MAKVPDIERIDAELRAWGVPIRDRPLKLFKRLYGPIHDPDLRTKLFEPITAWYLGTYGDEVRWDGVLGKFPIHIRGHLYMGVALFAFEDKPEIYKEHILDLPVSISDTFNDSEFQDIVGRLTQARISYAMLRNLDIDDHVLSSEAIELFHMACKDLDSAVVLLKHARNIQGSIVASHEAAEKCLKIALLRSTSKKDPRKFSHDIPALFAELSSVEVRYSWLLRPANNLQKLSPSMQMRYKLMQRSEEDAVSAFNSSLHICGVLAEIWLFDHARGSDTPTFRECRFYKNGLGNTYYCKKILGKQATLTYFHSDSRWGSQMADIKMNLLQSSLYLEVKDAAEDQRLRDHLIALLKNPGERANPDELKIEMRSGDEGTFNTMMIKRRIEPGAPSSAQLHRR